MRWNPGELCGRGQVSVQMNARHEFAVFGHSLGNGGRGLGLDHFSRFADEGDQVGVGDRLRQRSAAVSEHETLAVAEERVARVAFLRDPHHSADYGNALSDRVIDAQDVALGELGDSSSETGLHYCSRICLGETPLCMASSSRGAVACAFQCDAQRFQLQRLGR